MRTKEWSLRKFPRSWCAQAHLSHEEKSITPCKLFWFCSSSHRPRFFLPPRAPKKILFFPKLVRQKDILDETLMLLVSLISGSVHVSSENEVVTTKRNKSTKSSTEMRKTYCNQCQSRNAMVVYKAGHVEFGTCVSTPPCDTWLRTGEARIDEGFPRPLAICAATSGIEFSGTFPHHDWRSPRTCENVFTPIRQGPNVLALSDGFRKSRVHVIMLMVFTL